MPKPTIRTGDRSVQRVDASARLARLRPRFLAVIFIVAACLVGTATASSVYADCVVDAQGSDDQPGQKDLSELCQLGTCAGGRSDSWSFDDVSWTGSNTGDSCALIDTNGNGKVDRAICVTIAGLTPAITAGPACYTCDDSKAQNCAGSVATSCATTCSLSSGVDPFAGDQSHTQQKCNGTDCRTEDTTITCCIATADLGGGVFTDVCSYASSSPTSDAGDCITSPTKCTSDDDCDDANPCTVDVCDTTIKQCVHTAGNAGATCRAPAGVCDVEETCTGTDIFCPADQFASSGVCRNKADLCDVAESCDGSGPDCPADAVEASGTQCRDAAGQCDVAEFCDGSSTACPTDAFKPDDTACDDGDACTADDVCTNGVCTGGDAPNCDEANGCTTDGCDPSSGCTHVNNNDPCDDGNACTTADACSGGSCAGGPPPDCNDHDVCTDDGCDQSTGCTHTDNTAPCDDGNACTTSDACSGGSCVGGPAPNCDDGNACTTDSCNETTGCAHDPVGFACCNEDADCADTDECTVNERCENNACMSDPRNCDDANGCTDDGCNAQTGCTHTDNNDACDDGDACTTSDACSGGKCVGGPPPDCNDHDVCTDDGCDSTTGCTHTDNTAPCDDGNACTTNDGCSGGDCVGGAAPNCDDSNDCTDDDCDPSSGCTHTNNDDPCDDGNGCTVGDVCSGGTCHSGAPKDCSSHNGCIVDSCDAPAGTCQHVDDDGAPCSDDNPCTVGDYCSGGACQGGGDLDCNDHLGCTVDSCDILSGCVHDPIEQETPCCENDGDCIDSDACTVNERCVDHTCVSDPRNCADQDPCTVDRCDSQGGGFLCVHDNCYQLPGQPCPRGVPQCIPGVCGNGVVEGDETCDPPDSSIDPLTNQVRCRADCTSCGDGVLQTKDHETCDDGNSVSGCDGKKPLDACLNSCRLPECKDPARILYSSAIDEFDTHGRLITGDAIDLAQAAVIVELTDSHGRVLYRRSLEPGTLVPNAFGSYKFHDRYAKTAGGVSWLRLKKRSGYYILTAKTYGNLFKAGADMTTNVYVQSPRQNHQWSLPCAWDKLLRGWRCTGRVPTP